MRLHLISLPHTQVSPAFCGCAYTQKILKFCKMMDDYDIHLYAPEGPDVHGATLHPCLTNDERIKLFGEDDTQRLPDWPSQEQTALFNQRVIQELKPEPHDLILLSGGWTHHSIAQAFPNNINCEPGVGYEGIYSNFCAFESYAWMHHVYAKKDIKDGRFFDAVIPNYFDPNDFPLLNPGKGEYLLFLGRIVQRKGVHIASEIANRCGLPLLVAGAGGRQIKKDVVAPEVTVKNAEYVGAVNIMERAKLLAGAKALLVPTTYIEPFGGVAVEAMMCGTPVVTTDWGAFSETVSHGITGFRFHTLSEAESYIRESAMLNPKTIRDYALSKYSLSAVKPMFDRWFNQLTSLWGKGWYQ